MIQKLKSNYVTWEEEKIGQICHLINGRAFKPTEWSSTGLKIVRIQNLNDETKPFNYYDKPIDAKFIINNGEVLISWSGTPGTSFGAHLWNRGEAVLNQHIFRVVLDESKCLNKFFIYAINWRIEELICKAHGGVGLRHITKKELENVTIPIPFKNDSKRSLDIQSRIVARIEALLAEVQESRSLINQIRHDAEQFIYAALEEVFKETVSRYDLELLESHIIHLTSGSRGWSKYANQNNNGSLFIRVGNVGFSCMNLSGIERLNLPSNIREAERAKVISGDVLVTITGTIGRCCVVPENLGEAYVNQHIALIRLKESLEPRYLMWFILSPSGGATQTSAMQYGQTKPGLSLTNVRNLNIPVPKKSVQRQIVSYLDSIQKEMEEILKVLEQDAKLLDMLEQSILERAFQGEL